MPTGVARRTVEAVERGTARAETPDELLEGVATEGWKAGPYDAAMWFGVDPSTLLAVAPARMENVDEGYCEPFWHNEFNHHDANLFWQLARDPVPAATLRNAMRDKPKGSPRYRDFIQPQGYDDELRAVFRAGESTWGVASLFREKSRDPFSDDDVALFTAISGIVGAGLRRQAAAAAPVTGLMFAPGLLIFDADGHVVSANDAATAWLDVTDAHWVGLVLDSSAPDVETAVPMVPLLARARAIAAGHTDGTARLRLRDRSGRWIVMHASALAGDGVGGHVAVVIEPAKSADVAPIVIEAYGLTPRERDIVRCIARGSSTPEIAGELFLSQHTVRDYIKAVFDKVGVSSRAELVAKLFAEHYADPFHAEMIHLH